MANKNRNRETLKKFIRFCDKHPELRFWQAIYSWMNAEKIEVDGTDPFYWEGERR